MDDKESYAWFALKSCGAIKEGHFVYASDNHGSVYVNKNAVFLHTQKTSDLCQIIAERFADYDIEVVIGPVVGGAILSQWVAHHLSKLYGKEVLSVYADKTDTGGFVIKRGYDKLIAGKRVLVVEDVLTTGGSAREVIETTRAVGGEVIGIGVLCNRGAVTPKDLADVPELFTLVDVKFDAWDEKECPLCAKGVPINPDAGKGREYLASKVSQ